MALTTLAPPTTYWTFGTAPPPRWAADVQACGGGFFHSPLGLQVGAPEGQPIYAWYSCGGEVQGVALGVLTSCRLSGRARHAYFPTWPAFGPQADPLVAQPQLAAALHDLGLAEARWDSFDAAATTAPASVPTRNEYVIDLAAMDDQFIWPDSSRHRRALRRGERDGWSLRRLDGPAALAGLGAVMEEVTHRVEGRGQELSVQVPVAAGAPSDPAAPWELATYAALAGEELLAAVSIGVSVTRAFYVMGGATPAGYRCGGSAWLHGRLATRFAAAGLSHYNLGGVPVAGATDQEHPAHGLHVFKVGFGARVVPCAGDRWILRSAHVRGHQLLGWAAGVMP